jgi:hypothetical protein
LADRRNAMLRRNIWLGFGALRVAGAAACSGSTGSTVSSSDGGGADAPSTSSGGEGGPSGDDAGADGWIIMGASSGTGTSSSGAADGGGRVLGDGGPNQIVCGAGGPCDSTNQVCCAKAAGRTCTTAAMCTGDVLACSGSNSCSTGEVCCEEVSGLNVKSVCLAACPAGSPQLCTPGQGDCKRGEVCVRGRDGYAACVAVARDGGGSEAGTSDAAGD